MNKPETPESLAILASLCDRRRLLVEVRKDFEGVLANIDKETKDIDRQIAELGLPDQAVELISVKREEK